VEQQQHLHPASVFSADMTLDSLLLHARHDLIAVESLASVHVRLRLEAFLIMISN
jgi:hypothetical protein